MKSLDLIAGILLIVGGLNFGLEGAFSYDLIGTVFSDGMFTTILYDLVGLSAVYKILKHFEVL